MTALEQVNTAKVKGRRRLSFQQLDDILADAERLAASPYRQLGNWPLGQCCGHLSRSMRLSLEGLPERAPWWLRFTLGNIARPIVLNFGMRPGFKLPVIAQAQLIPAATLSNREALDELKMYIARLKNEPQRFPHPLLGRLSREQWNCLHLRHAELHLSFYVPSR